MNQKIIPPNILKNNLFIFLPFTKSIDKNKQIQAALEVVRTIEIQTKIRIKELTSHLIEIFFSIKIKEIQNGSIITNHAPK